MLLSAVIYIVEVSSPKFSEKTFPYIPEMFTDIFVESVFGLKAVYQVAALAVNWYIGTKTSLKCMQGDGACPVKTATI